jgi:hypothetical protein
LGVFVVAREWGKSEGVFDGALQAVVVVVAVGTEWAPRQHIISLNATREKALALDTDDFVVRNLTDQIEAWLPI